MAKISRAGGASVWRGDPSSDGNNSEQALPKLENASETQSPQSPGIALETENPSGVKVESGTAHSVDGNTRETKQPRSRKRSK